jgi:EF hand
MLSRKKTIFALAFIVCIFAIAAPVKTAIAAGKAQATPSPAPAVAPDPAEVAAASPEALRLLKLMDIDKNGKISHAEYMAFMEAEFQRLDINHDGELDLKELVKSQLAVVHRGGTRR